MDVATHALVGWTLSRAGLNRLTPHATWICVLGATIPDADAVMRLKSHSEYLLWHRGPTHSWIIAPVLAVVCVALVRLLARQPLPLFKAGLVALAGIASHLLIDAINPWGAQWLWPLSERWFQADLIVRGDPWIGAILLIIGAAPFLSRLVSSEIGAKSSGGRGAAIFALVLALLYIGARQQFHVRAIAMLESRIYDRLPPNRSAAAPDPISLFTWNGLVDTGSFVRSLPVPTLGEFDPDAGETFFPPENKAAVAAIEQSELYQRLKPRMTWSYVEAIPEQELVRVTVRDLRIGLSYQGLVSRDGSLKEELVTID